MRSAMSAPIPRSHGQIGLERSGGLYCGACARLTTCVAAVASIARSPESTMVAASAVSAATRPPRATVSRSASIAAADW